LLRKHILQRCVQHQLLLIYLIGNVLEALIDNLFILFIFRPGDPVQYRKIGHCRDEHR